MTKAVGLARGTCWSDQTEARTGHSRGHALSAVNYLSDEESLITAPSPANLAALPDAETGPLTSNIDETGGFIETRPGLSDPDYGRAQRRPQ
jgi:hypothetical protein